MALSWLGGAVALAACSSTQPDRQEMPIRASVPSTRPSPASGSAGAADRPPAPRSRGASVAIATGGVRETDYRIGLDLTKFIAPDAHIELEVLATKGSADNLRRLVDDRHVDLAIVQYDVMQAMRDEARRGDAAAARITAPLRIVTALYTEEIYFVARADAPMNSVDDMRGKRINLGVQGSGSALTAAALYRRMFRTPIAASHAQYLSNEQALAALTVDKTIDVVVIVAGQPVKLLTDMTSAAGNYIKLLAAAGDSPAMREARKVYLPATIRSRSYPTWLGGDIPALSVVSFLVTTDRRDNALSPLLGDFARSLCRNFDALKAGGHPKWREVALGQQLGSGWKYAATSEAEFKRCTAR